MFEKISDRDALKNPLTRFSSWIWTMPDEKERGLKIFPRAFCRISIIVFQEFLRDNIPVRAGALSFIIVLSMVPVLALGTSILKGLTEDNELRKSVHLLIVQFESSPENQAENFPFPPDPEENHQDQSRQSPREEQFANTLGSHLHEAVDFVFDYVEKTNFAALGALGIFFLLLTLFIVLSSIEQTMNNIWKTRGGRSPWRKLLDYLALMVIMPLTVNFGIAAWAVLHNEKLMGIIKFWLPGLGVLLVSLVPVFVLIATFTFFYGFLPHTKVKPVAALAGGIVGGLSWLVVQSIYFNLQTLVVNYNAIYGSFATLPLFLVWINLSWMVFLTGAEVSFATQTWRRYQRHKLPLTPIGRLGLAFEIISTTAENYRQQKITTKDGLVTTLGQPDAHINEILDTLHEGGHLRYVEENGGGYVPSAPLSQINTREIGELFMGELPMPLAADNPAIKALDSIRESLADQKLSYRDQKA